MQSNFSHYIITRYNVPYDGWTRDASGSSTKSIEWLSHRYDLFIKYCFPSIVGQTNQHFKWLIYVDIHTDHLYVSKLRDSLSKFPHFELRVTNDYQTCMKDIKRTLSLSPTEFVITSRVDNDDALGIHYVDRVQQQFNGQPDTLLNFLNGNGYAINYGVITGMYNIIHNHFTSLIERRKQDESNISVLGFPHDDPPGNIQVINVDAEHSWLKIFHDRNLKSKVFGYPIFHKTLYRAYNIDKNNFKNHLTNTLFYIFQRLYNRIKL